MSKHHAKAKKLVQGAVGTFSNAITEVNKANELLASAVQDDVTEMERISKDIERLYKRLDVVQAEKINKEAEIIQNKELIAKFEKFTR